jgi:DNA-binding CsgD family transcriptional regulator/tetratricopeptide (TPR) repeat protein
MVARPQGQNADNSPWGDELPLVGRRRDSDALRLALDDALDGRGHTLLLTGESGVGKSRLLAELTREARAREMLIASGRAFTVEAAVPFGALADALSTPMLALEPGALSVLARGTEDDLRAIVPALPRTAAPARSSATDADGRSRLFWNVAQFLARLAARQPVLLLLDNAHWSDPSSLEFLHFLARQIRAVRLLIVLAYVDTGAEDNSSLRHVERSLLNGGEATQRRIDPLSAHDLSELLQRVFGLSLAEAELHSAALFAHTRGNSFFVEQSLKALIRDGRIHRGREGWIVEDATPETLPATVRDAVRARLETLSGDARRIAEVASIIQGRASLELLEVVAALSGDAFVRAIEELGQRRVLVEHRSAGDVFYEFSHPILQSTVLGDLSAARERALHGAVTAALEAIHGEASVAHATEIAQHLVRGQVLGADTRALHYLTAAGRDALARRADQEAARWLAQALTIAERLENGTQVAELLEDLGTAHQRLGDSASAGAAWHRALALADTANDQLARARLLHHLGLEASRAGDAQAALEWHEQGERAAESVQRADLVVRVRMLRALTLQTLGRHAEATATVRDALPAAESLGDDSLLARVHQTALQLYAWTGPAATAREHGAQALALAEASGDREVAWRTHWSLAMLEGLTGRADGVARHVREASRLADELSSPVLQAMTAEIRIEHASGVGRWSEGVALAERTIPFAREVAPQALLPRLLVWTGLIVLARSETARARALFEEAWQLTGAEQAFTGGAPGQGLGGVNVQNVILAHTGMGAYHLARGAWARAMLYAERGLALADQFGYVAWAIHRLIPIALEAGLFLEQFDRVQALTARLREQSTALDHRLGLAWAAAADALMATYMHRAPDAAERLIEAAEALDAIPFVFHAARVRRTAAQVLEMRGETAAAVRELRRAHDVFARLGAESELRETRSQLRSLGVRLPPRTTVEGAGSLTGREVEIARAVARRLSNKEIGAALGISARTVSTHLSNVFEKLGVDSRGALADRMRNDPLLSEA